MTARPLIELRGVKKSFGGVRVLDGVDLKVAEGQTFVLLVGNLISNTLLAPNQPLAAAFTLWPLLIIVVYLLTMKRVGAFESV